MLFVLITVLRLTVLFLIFRLLKDKIADEAYVVGSLERLWRNSMLMTENQLETLPKHRGKVWMFRRCLIGGILFHSKSYKRVTARNDYTVQFKHLNDTHFGSIHTYAKAEEKCLKALCNEQKCCCDVSCNYFAIVEVLEKQEEQLPLYRGRRVINHIIRVKESKR